MIRRPPRSTLDRSSAASDVYKRQLSSYGMMAVEIQSPSGEELKVKDGKKVEMEIEVPASMRNAAPGLSLIHISEPTRPY